MYSTFSLVMPSLKFSHPNLEYISRIWSTDKPESTKSIVAATRTSLPGFARNMCLNKHGRINGSKNCFKSSGILYVLTVLSESTRDVLFESTLYSLLLLTYFEKPLEFFMLSIKKDKLYTSPVYSKSCELLA